MKKENVSCDDKSQDDDEESDSSGRVEFHIDGDTDPNLELMDYQNQGKLGLPSYLYSDVDASSMDYRDGDKSERSSELSSLSDFPDGEGRDADEGRGRSYSTLSQNERFRADSWFDRPGVSGRDQKETGKTSEAVDNANVKDSNENKISSTSEQTRMEIAVPCENHFDDDGGAAGIYALTTASTSMEMTISGAMDALSNALLSDQKNGFSYREKVRHPSGVSTVDTLSGRSTPDCVFRYDNTEKTNWDGSARLIGNIMCIIPKSSLPIIVGGPSQTDGESCGEADRNDSKNVCDSAASDALASDDTEMCVPEDSACSRGEAHSLDVADGDLQLNAAVKPSADENSTTTNATNTLNVPEKCALLNFQSRPSTSILTELTDFSDPLLGYQNTHDESIFNSTSTQKIALKEIKQTNYKRFRKALDGVHLSVSPYHKYSVPFIETDKGSRCAVRKYLPEEIYWSKLFDGEENQWQIKSKAMDVEVLAKVASKNNIQILDPHSLITCKLTDPIWDSNTQVGL